MPTTPRLFRSLLSLFLLLLPKPTLAAQSGSRTPPPADSAVTIPYQGSRFHVVVQGKGTPCLVLGSSLYYPRTFSKRLRSHFRLYFADLRWFAKASAPTPVRSYTLDTLIAEIDTLRKALKLEKTALMGHSIHGTIAMEYARRHPKNISHLMMIGSPVIFGNVEYDQATEAVWKTASPERQKLQEDNWHHQADFSANPARKIVEDYLTMAPKYWYLPRYDARWLWNGLTIQADLLHHLYNDLFHDYRMFGERPSVPVPTFVAMGRYDYVIPCSLWERYRSVPDLTLRVFEKSGHTPQLEQPEPFDTALIRWFERHRRPDRKSGSGVK